MNGRTMIVIVMLSAAIVAGYAACALIYAPEIRRGMGLGKPEPVQA